MNTGSFSSNAGADTPAGRIHSSATQSLGSEERKEDEEMRHTGIIQSERQVFEMARNTSVWTGGEHEASGL
jgi:hypothetical protein